jgi:DNA-binding transcriptional ArsR family regulator
VTSDPKNLEQLKQVVPEAAELLRQLSNPNRLLLLCHIAGQECSVGELEHDLGIKQPGLSQQLAELRQAGLVKTRRQSRSIYYSIADERTQGILAMLWMTFCQPQSAAMTLPIPPASSPTGPPANRSAGAANFARVIS